MTDDRFDTEVRAVGLYTARMSILLGMAPLTDPNPFPRFHLFRRRRARHS